MAKVLFFNHWFSSIVPIINSLKEIFKDDITVIGSSRNENHAMKSCVDKFIDEKTYEYQNNLSEDGILESEELKGIALTSSDISYIYKYYDICKANKVDFFFCRENAELISKVKRLFENIGTTVIVEGGSVHDVILSKPKVYSKLAQHIPGIIPEYFSAMGMSPGMAIQMMHTIIDNSGLSGRGQKVWCIKKSVDEGGQSFREIEDIKDVGYKSLSKYRVNKLSKAEAHDLINSLSETELQNIFLMERLGYPEISIDCYSSKKGFIAICREKKAGTRGERVFCDPEISDMCQIIGDVLGITGIYNVQFRAVESPLNGSPNWGMSSEDDELFVERFSFSDFKLLDINPRISGGLYHSFVGGLNLAEVMYRDLIGNTDYDINKYTDFDEFYTTYIETAVKL